ncbi:adhesion exoprotein [Levilactobacillus hammesii DSM 16381]|uniref:Adhesion exoprotein n=1 Tax=Levilactobacillus hammesii DSM 16381 TaxID=1423753 RepID=A0A0R1UWR9_9LACO|nr:adhesion exoprotein [Levilactobacillus hammesii DSM 16381]
MPIPASVDTTTPDVDGFSYVLNGGGDGYIITGYSGTSKNIVIPDAHTGSAGTFNVSEIADKVFENAGITSLTMGAHIQIIGEAAFENNLLTTVDFSKDTDSLWDIKANAFNGNKLTGVLTLPTTIKQIENSAFEGNETGDGSGNHLTGVNFGQGDQSLGIGDNVFSHNALTSIALPKGTWSVGASAFAYNYLTTIDLGSALQVIGKAAFLNNKITAVTIPGTVTKIENNAFQYNQISQLDFDNANALKTIGESTFDNNLLTSVVIPDKVETIGTAAFSTNSTLTQLTLGKNVQSIGDAAFAGDSIGGNLYIPNTVATIGNTAFAGNHLAGLQLGDGSSELQTIGSAAFSGNTTLTGKLVIPDSVTFINDGAFARDTLTEVDFGKSTGTIGNDAFVSNHLTGTLTLSDGIQHVNDDAFAGNHLTGLKLGTGLVTIGNNAFAGNQVTGTLEVPDLVTTIGENAFGSNQLKALTLGKSVKTIGATAFANNQLQGTLVVPGSVTDVGASAFASNQLRGIQLNGPVNSMGNGAFSDNNLQQIQATQPITHLGDNALAGQKTLAVTVNESGNQLTGIRAAIAKQLQLQNFSLTNPMIFMLNGTQVTYDPVTDALTLPAGFSGNRLVLSLASGTTGDATDHSGNYGVAALTLDWSTPNHGSGTTSPTTPTNPIKPTISTEPAQPATPTTAATPGQSASQPKPTKRSPKKVPSRQVKQHQTRGMAVKHTGRRAGFKLTDPVNFSSERQKMSTPAWSYTHQSAVVKRGAKVDGQVTQEQTQLPQTYERPNYWSAIGATLLTVLAGLGLGARRQHR